MPKALANVVQSAKLTVDEFLLVILFREQPAGAPFISVKQYLFPSRKALQLAIRQQNFGLPKLEFDWDQDSDQLYLLTDFDSFVTMWSTANFGWDPVPRWKSHEIVWQSMVCGVYLLGFWKFPDSMPWPLLWALGGALFRRRLLMLMLGQREAEFRKRKLMYWSDKSPLCGFSRLDRDILQRIATELFLVDTHFEWQHRSARETLLSFL